MITYWNQGQVAHLTRVKQTGDRVRVGPDVIAGAREVLPANRCEVGEIPVPGPGGEQREALLLVSVVARQLPTI